MIVAEQKPIKEILQMVEDYQKILVVGCRACVTVCAAGGKKDVEIISSLIRIDRKRRGLPVEVYEAVIDRQCDPLFFAAIDDLIQKADAVLSLGCAVGVNMLAETYPNKVILPGLNTGFMGLLEEQGIWAERCIGCMDCMLVDTGGICPLARCPKQSLDGPCLGSINGQCVVFPENKCVWYVIYERLKNLNQLDKLGKILKPRDWSKTVPPRRVVREDLRL